MAAKRVPGKARNRLNHLWFRRKLKVAKVKIAATHANQSAEPRRRETGGNVEEQVGPVVKVMAPDPWMVDFKDVNAPTAT